jgi:uncharacterized protein (TIGR02246 family)
MDEDVVFLIPGGVMRGREEFANNSHANQGPQKMTVEPTSDIQEIEILGDHAYVWNKIRVVTFPEEGGGPATLSGNSLSIFRKNADGKWVIIRDANTVIADKKT